MSTVTTYKLLPDVQSAHHVRYSTVIAVVKVLSDILRAVDDGDVSLLTLLDLSTAFETVDHGILLHQQWLKSGWNTGRTKARPIGFRISWEVMQSPPFVRPSVCLLVYTLSSEPTDR